MRHYWFATTLIAACAGKADPADTGGAADADTDADTDTDTDTDTDADPTAAPSVTASFDPARVAPGEPTELLVTVENFTVVDPTSSPPPVYAPGEGHYHLYLDGQLFVAAWTPTVPIATSADDLPGDYVFRIALVDSEHNEIVPTVETEATLTIE